MTYPYHNISNKIIGKLASARGNGGVDDHMSLDTWEWPQGVALYAMCKTYLETKDGRILDLLETWYGRHLQEGLPNCNVNTTAPMIGMVMLYEITRNGKYEKPISDWASWIILRMPRTQENGLQHVTSHDENDQQLWDDTLYMTVLFLYRAGLALHRTEWMEEAKYQFLLHIKYLHCHENNLWYHGFSFLGRHHFADAFWARGNGWYTAAAADMLEIMPSDSVSRIILETYKGQCEALIKLQSPTGLWHTLLDREDSYLETSASAAIAYGLMKGIRLGCLPESCRPYADKAVQAVLSQVAEDGTVLNVSYGTPMGDDLNFYRSIPIRPTAYGQGLVFLMLTEKMIRS